MKLTTATLLVSCCASLAGVVHLFQRLRCLQRELSSIQAQCEAEQKKRAAERTGRTNAERQVRELLLQQATTHNGETAENSRTTAQQPPGRPQSDQIAAKPRPSSYPLRPIGHLESCFTQRNGTPRQPLLVPLARARLTLRPDVPAACLEGLQQFSHVWVLYLFHCNTDLPLLWTAADSPGWSAKAKVRVPRLNGARCGIFATRTPHRPCPIGLSVGTVIAVEGRSVLLGGLDVVDGSPVLDVKPYLPFCDSVPRASAPDWVQAERSGDEPLHVAAVHLPPHVEDRLRSAWLLASSGSGRGAAHSGSRTDPVVIREAEGNSGGGMSNSGECSGALGRLYGEFDDFRDLLVQVLSRDIRSVHQRTHKGGNAAGSSSEPQLVKHPGPPSVGGQSAANEPASTIQPDGARDSAGRNQGKYHIVLQGVDVCYDVDDASEVHVRGADTWRTSDVKLDSGQVLVEEGQE